MTDFGSWTAASAMKAVLMLWVWLYQTCGSHIYTVAAEDSRV